MTTKEGHHLSEYLRRGDLLRTQARPQEAEAEYRAAVELEPTNEDARYRLFDLYMETGREEEAFRELDRLSLPAEELNLSLEEEGISPFLGEEIKAESLSTEEQPRLRSELLQEDEPHPVETEAVPISIETLVETEPDPRESKKSFSTDSTSPVSFPHILEESERRISLVPFDINNAAEEVIKSASLTEEQQNQEKRTVSNDGKKEETLRPTTGEWTGSFSPKRDQEAEVSPVTKKEDRRRWPQRAAIGMVIAAVSFLLWGGLFYTPYEKKDQPASVSTSEPQPLAGEEQQLTQERQRLEEKQQQLAEEERRLAQERQQLEVEKGALDEQRQQLAEERRQFDQQRRLEGEQRQVEKLPQEGKNLPLQFGILMVNANPWGEVYLDGRKKGETPLTIKLSAGKHLLKIKRNGLSDIVQEIGIEPNQTKQLNIP